MDNIVNSIIAVLFLLGSGYTAKKILFSVEKTALERISKGLSKSEPFAQKLTEKKLDF